VSPELSIRAVTLEQGGSRMWSRFMADLREEHLGIPSKRRGKTVRGILQEAYERVVKGQAVATP